MKRILILLALALVITTPIRQSWADIQVQGYLNNAALENLAADPVTGLVEGRIYWDSVLNLFRVYDGTTWNSIATAGTVPDPLQLGDGSVGTPTYSFSNETGLGLYRHGAGQLGITGTPIIESEEMPWSCGAAIGIVAGSSSCNVTTVTGGCLATTGACSYTSTGRYVLTWNSSFWASKPYCTFEHVQASYPHGGNYQCGFAENAHTTTSGELRCYNAAGNSVNPGTTNPIVMTCVGQRAY